MVDLRLTAAATILALATMSGASAQEATELWALDGLSAPESALFDEARDVLYVSNVAGQPTERNGAGFISRVSPAGEIEELEWVTGLDAPKGLALDGATLYVTDIDRLVAIDVEAGEIVGTWAGEGAQFLNDPAVDGAGRVFVSDMATSAIYLLDDDDFTLWLQDEALQHPNGLKVADGRLIVAAWGQDMQPDFSTRVPGHLLAVDLASKAIAPLGSGAPVGNLDGLEPDGDGNWLATDWIAGALFRISPDGSYQQLLDLDQGSADIGYIARERVVIIPMMMNDRIVAYRLE